jgi:Sulfotransferase family
MRGPVIVTGIQRSGTTLLGRIVAGHPQASFTVNGKLLYGLLHWVRANSLSGCELSHIRADEILHMLQRKPILGVCEDFLPSIVGPELHEWAQSLAADRHTACQGDTDIAIRSLLARIHLRLNPRATFWGDKYNEYMLMVPVIQRLFPEARFVVIVRDVDAVARSMCRAFQGRPWCPPSPAHAVVKCQEWWLEWETARRGLPAGSWIQLRFEDLVARPATTLRTLADFLDLPAAAFAPQYSWIRSSAGDLPESKEAVYG